MVHVYDPQLLILMTMHAGISKRRRSLPTEILLCRGAKMEIEHTESATAIMEEGRDGRSDTDQLQESNVGQDNQSHIAIRPVLKYPYGAMFFMMTSTVGLG